MFKVWTRYNLKWFIKPCGSFTLLDLLWIKLNPHDEDIAIKNKLEFEHHHFNYFQYFICFLNAINHVNLILMHTWHKIKSNSITILNVFIC